MITGVAHSNMQVNKESYSFSLKTNENQSGQMYIFTHPIGSISPNQELPLHQLVQYKSSLVKHGLTLVDGTKNLVQNIDVSAFISVYLSDTDVLCKLQNAIAPGKWDLYSLMPAENGCIEVVFGVVLPLELQGYDFVIRCEGEEPISTSYFYDHNFGASHWFMPIECIIGVKCCFKMSKKCDWFHFDLQFLDPTVSSFSTAYRAIANFTDLQMLSSLPDNSRIHRVASTNANQSSFLNSGRTAFLSLRRIASLEGVEVGTLPLQILDWGVGCGRVARHFSQEQGVRMTGIDIDTDNIAWCAENLAGYYKSVDLDPPTGLPGDSFDLIYACSVLSHLSEVDADKWLREIALLLKPSGLALLSYNGLSNSACYLSRRPAEFLRVAEDNLFDKDINHELDGFIASQSYYRASFASDKWWEQRFKAHFNIRRIEYSVLSGHQHVAILSKK